MNWFWKRAEQRMVSLDNPVEVKDLLCDINSANTQALAYAVCVEMIANALSLCEFKTFEKFTEKQQAEYWLWNYEPNVNQNGSEFIKKIVRKLFYDGEVLIFEPRARGGESSLAVADSFAITEHVSRQNEYSGIICGNQNFIKTFKEKDVLHIQLDNDRIKNALENIDNSYDKLLGKLIKNETWKKGQHWKVHINQIAQNADDFNDKFAKMIERQIKPFFNGENTILPEFDGFTYSQIGTDGETNDSKLIAETIEEIFNETAKAFMIPIVLVSGKVEATNDANARFLTYCIDPLAKTLEKEIIRKRYGAELYEEGTFLRIDTSNILHFDLFANASNVEKIVGSGCYTINDIRKSAGQVPINEPWANDHYMTKNIGEVTTLGE